MENKTVEYTLVECEKSRAQLMDHEQKMKNINYVGLVNQIAFLPIVYRIDIVKKYNS